MSITTSIEWTDTTWNPVTGCTKVSPGCAHCYIERTPPFRIHGRHFVKGAIPLVRHDDRLEQPLHWRKPRRIFVNSLSDLFHDDIPDVFIARVYDTMQRAPWHRFQVLTKRSSRLRGIASRLPWPPNAWQGVSVENAAHVARIGDHAATQPAWRHAGLRNRAEAAAPLPTPATTREATKACRFFEPRTSV